MTVDQSARIFVAGHRGMVGAAIVRALREKGFERLLLRTRTELDLRNQGAVSAFMEAERPDYVIIAAAKVGGIGANNHYPAEFIYDNLVLETNLIHAAWRAGVSSLLFLGSSCIYPKLAPQPMSEECLLTGPLEPTNEPYAIAKIAGIKLCESYNRQYGTDFRSVMPTNLYGPGDNFNLANSHVVPALIRKFHEATRHHADSVEVWGSGKPRREFLYVDDLADACIFLMGLDADRYWHACAPMCSHVNVGTGTDLSIRELASMIGGVTGFDGRIQFNAEMPDGAPRKLLDVSKMRSLGWEARTGLKEGLERTYSWFVEHEQSLRS